MPGLHRKAAAFAAQHRCIPQQPGHRRSVQGGGHDHQPQVLPQQALHVPGKGQPQIGIEAALVELVEDHRADARERRVREGHAGEHPLRHHLDPGAGRDQGLEADAQADPLPHPLAQALGHPRRRRPGGQTAGFQQDDPPVLGPGGIHQRQGHTGGLARAGGRHQHRAGGLGQGRRQFRQDRLDRQHQDACTFQDSLSMRRTVASRPKPH